MAFNLVDGRTCGSCNVCCVALTIDDPQLQKAQGFRCRNAQPDNGCAVYEIRPDACRSFYCGWRLLKWVREPLRPDRSGVLVRLTQDKGPKGGYGLVVTLLNAAALNADGLAETVAAAVAAGLRVLLHVPGPPGYTAGQARIDQVLAEAVRARDKQSVLGILEQAYAQGLDGDHKPILLRPHKQGRTRNTTGPS